MMRHIHIIFCVCSVLQSCHYMGTSQQENERFAINELILLRTEGLILAERVLFYTDSRKVEDVCLRIQGYYRDTHPDFLHLCQNRTIDLREQDFDKLWEKVDNYLQESQYDIEDAFLNLCYDNIVRSITLYEVIIRRDEWEDISCFSYRALPDLYNQQKALQRVIMTTEE